MSNATNLINTILSLFTILFINNARASRTRKSLSCGAWKTVNELINKQEINNINNISIIMYT